MKYFIYKKNIVLAVIFEVLQHSEHVDIFRPILTPITNSIKTIKYLSYQQDPIISASYFSIASDICQHHQNRSHEQQVSEVSFEIYTPSEIRNNDKNSYNSNRTKSKLHMLGRLISPL